MRYLLTALVLVVVLSVSPVAGQEWSSDQQEVWKAVMSTWDVENVDWCAAACHPNVLAWGEDYPAPRNKDQVSAWLKRDRETSTTLEAQVTPFGIVVQGDTAVAHYYYTTLSENKEGKRKTEHGRYTDVLLKEDGQWLYIAWSGGELDD